MALLIYLFPALLDAIAAQTLFVNTLRAAQMGCSDVVISGLWAAWSLPYVGMCVGISRILTERNAGRLIAFSCILFLASSLGNLFATSIGAIYVWTVAPAIAAGFFFPPFQVFMKKVDRGQSKPVTYSTGWYTFSWSMGFAFGPWLSGFLMEAGDNGWRACYGVSAVVAILSGTALFILDHKYGQRPAPVAPAPVAAAAGGAQERNYSSMPDLAWLGWVGAGGGLVVLSIIRGIFPAMGEKLLHLTESVQGNVFFLLSIAQAFTGLAMVRSRTWMYSAWWVSLFGAIGFAGAALFAVGRTPTILYLAASLFGIYSGSFYFYFVFHALAHPSRAPLYVSINEMIVGVAGFVAPLLAGWLAQASGSYALTFGAGCAVVLVTTAFQMAVHARTAKRMKSG